MTFTEAALEVLRLTGKPLHFKDIARIAIEKNLLSHVGKNPETTMGVRLTAAVKKSPDGPLVRQKPQIFALRDWEKTKSGRRKKDEPAVVEPVEAPEVAPAAEVSEAIEGASAEVVDAVEAAAPAYEPIVEAEVSDDVDDDDDATADQVAALATEVQAAEDASKAEARESRGRRERAVERESPLPAAPMDDEDAPILDADERMRGQLAASASNLFEEEDDDDQPLLGGPEPAAPAQEGGRRRRRRRRRKGGRDDVQGASTATSSLGAVGGMDDEEETIGVTIGDERDEQPTRRAIVLERVPAQQGRNGRGNDFRAPPFQRERERDRERNQPQRDLSDLGASPALEGTEPIDEMAGRELADLVYDVLLTCDRGQGPVPLRGIAEAAQRRGRVSGDLNHATIAITAAVRADNLRREGAMQRARFRFAQGGRVAPTDWSLSPELLRAEQDALTALERYRDAARRALANKLQKDLSGPALVELLLTALERLGFRDIRPVRRAGLPGGESHFSAIHVSAAGDELRTALVLRRDGREIGRERVIDLRGSLHHYGPAVAGWLITTGQCLSGAREEAMAPGTTPIALFDAVGFARLLEDAKVGVVSSRFELALPDAELFEALRGL